GREQEDVVVEDRRGVKEIERQHEEHACQQVLREGEAVGERVEDVRLEERERVLAELVRAPRENPARQVVIGEGEGRGRGGQLEKRPVGTRDERPGPGDGEDGERGEDGHRRRKMLRHRGRRTLGTRRAYCEGSRRARWTRRGAFARSRAAHAAGSPGGGDARRARAPSLPPSRLLPPSRPGAAAPCGD